MTDPEARNHNWECQCGHTNYAVNALCSWCTTPRSQGERFRHMDGPRWVRWTREHQAGKALSAEVAA